MQSGRAVSVARVRRPVGLGQTVLLVGVVLLAGSCSFADVIFDQSFAGTGIPSGWELLSSATLPGGYLQLTPDAGGLWGSAFYTQTAFSSAHFVFTAEVNIGGTDSSPADGMTFSWVDSTKVLPDHSNLAGPGGGSLGMPDINDGFAFTLRGRPGTIQQTGLYRTNRAIAFSDAVYVFNHPGDNFYQNDGWQPVQLTCDNGAFAFDWGAPVSGGGYAHEFKFTIPVNPADPYNGFQAYDQAWFGVTGATGSDREYNQIKNVRLTAEPFAPTAVPEPSLAALFLIAGLPAFLAYRKRKRS